MYGAFLGAATAGVFAGIDAVWTASSPVQTAQTRVYLAITDTGMEDAECWVTDTGKVVPTEHVASRTYGSKGVATLQSDAGLSFRDVLARDIRDIRDIVGSKYNEGLRNLTDYYRRNFPDLMGK